MKLSTSRHRRGPRSRVAYVLIGVMVCLTVVMILTAIWVRTVARQQRVVRATADGVQAEYLAAAGVARAEAQLAGDANYRGETWLVDRQTLGTRAAAKVIIHVENDPARSSARRLSVEALYPADSLQRVRRTEALTIELPVARNPS